MVSFTGFPTGFSLDAGEITSFEREPYLLNCDGRLEIKKTYKRSALGANNPTVSIRCALPVAEMVEVIGSSNAQLKKRVKDEGLEDGCDLNVNASMRRALYDHYMATTTTRENHWVDIQKRQSGLDTIMPYFALFKADRLNSLKDAEVSEPVKYAVQVAINEAVEEIEVARGRVVERIQDILNRANTTMAESFGNGMPKFGATVEDDLSKAFSADLRDSRGIPLEKQGSGIRRLYMFNLLISEAKRKAGEAGRGTVIYAIEEPETSQHPQFQDKLMEALKLLATANQQVLFTTHNPHLLSRFPKECVRVVRDGIPRIVDCSVTGTLNQLVQDLGVLSDPLPNAHFRGLLVVEGPTDVAIIEKLKTLHPAFGTAMAEVWMVAGGGDTVKDWVRSQHFCDAGVPQFFLVDNDFNATGGHGETYLNLTRALRAFNRPDLQYLLPMRRREIEQYLHPATLRRCLNDRGISTNGLDAMISQLDNIRHPAQAVFESIGNHRTTPLPHSTPPDRGLLIQDMLASHLRGYSLLNGNHKRLVAEVFFDNTDAAEAVERFSYPGDNGTIGCELTDWAQTIQRALAN